MGDPIFLLGTGSIVLATGLLVFVLVGSTRPRAVGPSGAEQSSPSTSVVDSAVRGWVGVVDRTISRRGWRLVDAEDLELADVRHSAPQVVAAVSALSFLGLLAGLVLRQSLLLGLVTALLVPVGAKMWLRIRTAKRRRAFNSQLDSTLQMMASSLRAGQSFAQAVDSCARDADRPMADELARIVNENRIGRDIVDAMQDTADRMECEDFVWLAEAVETTRETGGNLNEIIDRVAQTLRERAEIREKIHAYAAEGRISSYILMGLPVIVAVAYSFISPGYLNPLFTESIGRLLLGASAVMFTIAFFWMRSIVNIKI